MKCSVEECDREVYAKGFCGRHYMRLRRTGKLTTVRMTGDFWTKVDKKGPDECWPWKGFVKPSGHGLTSIRGRPTHTSRKAWILTHGPIESEDHVLHKCDNAVCCNPAHMYLGTRIDNMIDRFSNPPPLERQARGRKHMLTDDQLAALWQVRRSGATLAQCAEMFGVHRGTICRYITAVRKAKLEKNRAARLSDPKNVPV